VYSPIPHLLVRRITYISYIMGKIILERVKRIKNLLKSPLYKCLYILFLCGVGLVIVEIATILFIVVCQLTDTDIVFLHDDDIYIVFGILLFLTNHIMHAILNFILYEPEYENKFRLWSNKHNGFICTILTMGFTSVRFNFHEGVSK